MGCFDIICYNCYISWIDSLFILKEMSSFTKRDSKSIQSTSSIVKIMLSFTLELNNATSYRESREMLKK